MRSLMVADLRARWRSLAGLGLGCLVVLLLITGTYSGLGGRAGVTRSFGSGTPAKMMSAISGSPSADIAVPANYIGFSFSHPLFLLLSITVAVSSGVGAIAADVESGRAEMLYTAPVSRTAVLGARLVGWLIAQTSVLACAVAGALIGSRLSSDLSEASAWVPLQLAVQFGALSFFFAAASFAASARAQTRGAALGAATAIAAGSYVANLVALLWHPLHVLRRLNPFGYYNATAAADHIQWLDALALITSGTLLLIVSRIWLENRDLT